MQNCQVKTKEAETLKEIFPIFHKSLCLKRVIWHFIPVNEANISYMKWYRQWQVYFDVIQLT